MAQDLPHLLFAVGKASRFMKTPIVGSWRRVKRIGRFLLGARRVVQVMRGDGNFKIEVYAHSDWAGDAVHRKSVTSVHVYWNRVLVRATSNTQRTCALSSGEAEFSALVRATSTAFGMVSVCRGLGLDPVAPSVFTDSAAAKGLACRRGVGTIRHLSTALLWIQAAGADNKVAFLTVRGDVNRADLGTKPLAGPKMWELVTSAGFRQWSGRHELSLRSQVTSAADADDAAQDDLYGGVSVSL